MVDRPELELWLNRLKEAWEGRNVDAAVALFERTQRYYERPFKAGVTQEDIRGYWKDIEGLKDIKFDYSIAALENNIGCVHWQNSFRTDSDDKTTLLDGVFIITFDEDGKCTEFRQWWFMEP